MKYLGLALFAEGPTDHAFLRPVLRRLSEAICASEGSFPVEVGDVLELHSPSMVENEDRETRVLQAARDAVGGWHVFFVHTDGGGDPTAARAERIEPACRLIVDDIDRLRHRPVAVVPVRETEAWTLADGHALRAVFGTNRSNAALGLPRAPQDVEGIQQPKRVFEEAYRAARGGRKGRRRRSVTVAFLVRWQHAPKQARPVQGIRGWRLHTRIVVATCTICT